MSTEGASLCRGDPRGSFHRQSHIGFIRGVKMGFGLCDGILQPMEFEFDGNDTLV